MIALLNNYEYYFCDCDSIKEFLISYANYICIDTKIFNILVDSGKMSIKELVEYINRFCGSNEEIIEIYEIGVKLY